jgi:hypothetical protein
LTDELLRSLHTPTVGGESHHLARIFSCLTEGKWLFFRVTATFKKVARLLYGLGQV